MARDQFRRTLHPIIMPCNLKNTLLHCSTATNGNGCVVQYSWTVWSAKTSTLSKAGMYAGLKEHRQSQRQVIKLTTATKIKTAARGYDSQHFVVTRRAVLRARARLNHATLSFNLTMRVASALQRLHVHHLSSHSDPTLALPTPFASFVVAATAKRAETAAGDYAKSNSHGRHTGGEAERLASSFIRYAFAGQYLMRW